MDTIHVYEFCLRAAEQTGGVVLPPTYWNANGHVGWTGSLLVRERTFRAIIRDIFALLSGQGVKLIVASTGHWPTKQGVTIAKLAREWMKRHPQTTVLALDPFSCHPVDRRADHAGKKETSLMLAIRPELVHMDTLSKREDVFRGIGKDAVDGNRAFGETYFHASLRNYVEIVKEALNKIEGVVHAPSGHHDA
jgi:creatinine amidohydrolase